MRVKKSFVRTVLLSYFSILLVAILVAVISFRGFSDAIAEQAEEYNQVILSQIRDALDERIHSSNKIIYNIATIPQVKKLARKKAVITPEDKYLQYEIMQTISSYITVHKSLDTISVYFPSTQQVISNRSVYVKEDLFLSQGAPAGLTQGRWDTIKQKTHLLDFYIFDQNVLAVGSLPSFSNAIILLTLAPDFLSDIAEQTLSLEENQVLVMDDKTQEVVFSFGNILEEEETFENKVPIEEYKNKGYQVTSLASEESELTYYFILSENPFVQKVQSRTIVLIIIIFLLGGLIGTLFLAYKTIQPVRRLAKTIEEGSTFDSEQKDNVAAIDTEMKRILSDYQTMQKDMEDLQPILQTKILNSLFTGELLLTLETQESLIDTVKFPYEEYFLILLSVETRDHKAYGWKNLEVAKYYSSRFDKEERTVYSAETRDDKIALLVNIPQYQRYAVEIEMNTLYTHFREKTQGGIIITATIGACKSALDIKETYDKCRRLLEAQLIRFPGVFAFADSPTIESSGYYYPFEIETQLINSVTLGKADDVAKILNEIVIENFFKIQISHQMTLVLFFNLMGTALRVIETLNYEMADIFGENIDWYERITSCNNVQEIEVTLRELFQTICEYIAEKNKEKGVTLIDQITEYITSNISDQNMSLATVASTFNIHPNYLSTFFKEETGENFLQFSNRIRVQYAEKLLLSTSLNVGEIAELSGYSTSSVFIRNFKREHGKTPGRYRQEMEINREMKEQ